MMKYLFVLAIVALMLLAAGCKGGGQSGTQQSGDVGKSSQTQAQMTAAMFGMDVQPIFTNRCALSSCHGDAKSADMQLSPGLAYSNIVNVRSSEDPSFMRIMPGQPDSSYLVMKIEGRQKVGVRMPAIDGPLSAKQIQAVRSWIEAGAKND